ncbi:MAG: UvrD-helicase domain-containing protein, partial [Gammaproteobacteria bacterium]|nr:UvrD-helicase domain-containing protein [Gammaproteobacteria bacterium]
MDVSHLLDALNDRQREAVSVEPGPILVLAGAGSGKTRVLTQRIAWVCEVEGLSPFSVLAVTFTNKAAAEMRARVESLLGISATAMWVGTFHGLAHRMLRAHWQAAGLPQNFQILDSDDQLRMIKRVVRELNLDEASWPPKQAQWYINHQKDEGLRAVNIDPGNDPAQQQLREIYQVYETHCARAGVVDFAELLLRALELIRDNDALRDHYQKRFRHILVDEFQDTNAIQYAWLRLLAGAQTPVFVVGDDDQSIYGWRGARIENIQHFERDFSDAKTIRLEQNYRSSGTILKAANALIDNI